MKLDQWSSNAVSNGMPLYFNWHKGISIPTLFQILYIYLYNPIIWQTIFFPNLFH